MLSVPALSLLLPLACGDKAGDTGDTGDSEVVASFPAGASAWTGSAVLAGTEWDLALDLAHTDGRVEGTVTIDPGNADLTFTTAGVVDRRTGVVVLVPGVWEGASPGIEVFGLTGTYDPDAGTLDGTIRDTTSWDDNVQYGGAFSLQTDAAPAQVDTADVAPRTLGEEASFSGTFRCLGDTRPMTGTLTRGADGLLTGEARWYEADESYVGTFAVEGLESEGWLSIQPLTWLEEEASSTNYANAWWDGTLTDGAFVGTLSQNIAADCEDGAVQLTFE